MVMKKIMSVLLASVMICGLFTGCKKEETVEGTPAPTEAATETSVYTGWIKTSKETNVVPNTSGKIVADYYKVGDYVSAGALLYQLEDNGISDNIATTKNSIAKNDISLSTANENLSNLTVYAPADGILSNFKLKAGERINSGTIGSIVDEGTLIAKVPFNTTQIASIAVGDSATVTSAELLSSVGGTVTRIHENRADSIGGSILYDVEITVTGRAGFKNGMSVNATVNTANGEVSSPVSGEIESTDSVSVVSRGSGNVRSVYVKDGDRVSKGQKILDIDNSTVNATLQRAEIDRKDLEIKLRSLEKDYADLFVYAPVSGVITSKSKELNDTASSSSDGIMTITDTSSYVMTIELAEKDLPKVSVGMNLPVKLDDGTVLNGNVTEVSQEGKTNGTDISYPVTLQITNANLTTSVIGTVDLDSVG